MNWQYPNCTVSRFVLFYHYIKKLGTFTIVVVIYF